MSLDPTKRVSKNFILSEFLVSQKAARLGIRNIPTPTHLANMEEAITNLFQPVRDLLKKPVIVTSGYRSVKLNEAVKGSATSAHCVGYAMDFTSPGFGTVKETCEFLEKELKERGIKFDQLIYEYGSWVHLAIKNRKGMQRGQVLTFKKDRNGNTLKLQGIVD